MSIDDGDENLFGLVRLLFTNQDVTKVRLAVNCSDIVFAKALFDSRQACSLNDRGPFP